jgi:hypothetical protein
MQIHELTKLQRTDEGLLDGVKAAITAVGAGPEQGGFSKAYRNARNDAYAKDSQTKLDAIAKNMNKGKKPGDPGYWIAPGQAGYDAQQLAKQNPKIAQKVNQYTTAFQNTFGTTVSSTNTAAGQHSQIGQVLPDPNRVLAVNINNVNYYKAKNGNWYNELGVEAAPSETAPFEKMIDQDQYKQVQIPTILDNKLKTTVPKVNSTQKIKPTPSNAAVEEAAPVYSPGAQARRNAIKVNPAQSNAAETPATAEHLPLTKFSQWADAKIPELKGAEQDPALKPEVLAIEKSKDVKQAEPFFKKLLTKAFSTGAGNPSYGYSGTDVATTGDQKQIAANFIELIKDYGRQGLFKALKDDPPKGTTGSNTLDAALRDAKVLAEELKAFKAGK